MVLNTNANANSNVTKNPQSQRHRWIVGLLLAIIFGPVVFAWVLVQKNDRIHLNLQHHGDLIKPLPQMQAWTEIDYTPYKGKWLMLVVAPNQCDAQQAERLQSLQQLQKALGKNTDCVQQALMFLKSSQGNVESSKDSCSSLITTFPEVSLLSLSETAFETQLGAFSHSIKRQAHGELFIVDPNGNIMMHYDATVPTGDILKDMKRLLRVSKIG